MTDQPGSFPGAGEPPVPPHNPYGSQPPAEGYQSPPLPPPPAEGYQAPPPPPPPTGYAPPAQESAYPPPPAAPAPAGAHQQQWPQGAANLQNFDPKSVNPLDWGIIGAGLLAFIFSFFSYYTATLKVKFAGVTSGSATGHESAWHGFFGWFAAFVALVSAGVLAAHLIAKITLPFPVRLAVLAGFGLSTLCVLLALLIVPIDTGSVGAFGGVKIDKGHGFGYWLSLIVIIAGTALAYKRFSDEGGKLPGQT
jgi:hypothetical protein